MVTSPAPVVDAPEVLAAQSASLDAVQLQPPGATTLNFSVWLWPVMV